jgi:hypothetical protein
VSDHDEAIELDIKALLGIGPEAVRMPENLEAYRDILAEIQKLRALDLRDVHPAIVFDPMLPYRK